MKAKHKIWKRKQAKALNTSSVVYFLRNPLVYRNIFTDDHYPSGYFRRTGTIDPGIFSGRALWADSGSPRMSTIAPRDQFKPIRIRENLVMYSRSRARFSYYSESKNYSSLCSPTLWFVVWFFGLQLARSQETKSNKSMLKRLNYVGINFFYALESNRVPSPRYLLV